MSKTYHHHSEDEDVPAPPRSRRRQRDTQPAQVEAQPPEAPPSQAASPAAAGDETILAGLDRDVFYAVTGKGLDIKARIADRPASGRGTAQARTFTLPLASGEFPGGLTLPLGLTLISGPTGVGKSALVADLSATFEAAHSQDRVLRLCAVEPFDDPADAGRPWFDTCDDALIAAVGWQREDAHILPVIDSLRSTLFEMNGPATSKGMVAKFFTQLTRVSNRLAAAGHTVIATVNPMQTEKAAVDEFLQRLAAALPALVVVQSRTRTPGGAHYTGYTVTRDLVTERRPIPFHATLGTSVKPTVEIEPSEVVSFAAISPYVTDGFAHSVVNHLQAVLAAS